MVQNTRLSSQQGVSDGYPYFDHTQRHEEEDEVAVVVEEEAHASHSWSDKLLVVFASWLHCPRGDHGHLADRLAARDR